VKLFRTVDGPLTPIDRVDVYTDQVTPIQFVKRMDRIGHGAFRLFARRFLEDGPRMSRKEPLPVRGLW